MRKVILGISFSSLLFSTVTLAQLNKLITMPITKIQIADTVANTYLYSVSKPAAGLLNSNAQIGLVAVPLDNDVNKKLQNHFDTIGQVKMSFGSLTVPSPFLFVNEMGSTNSIFSSQGNKPGLTNNNWMFRGILGIDSRPFFSNFTAGLGVGAAIINQNLNNNLAFLNMSATENTQIAIRPSVLANATWLSCPNCIGGLGGSISLQIAADQYPNQSMNINGISVEGFPFQSSSDQKWQMSETLVFTMHL